MATILGISAFYHDSAAAIISGGELVAAAQEERFTQVKHTSAFPSQAIAYCLEAAGLDMSGLDAVVYYEKPLLKFERLLETYYHTAPAGLPSFLKAMPVWVREKLFLKRDIRKRLQEISAHDADKVPLLFTEHHLSHAAGAYYPSGFADAAILTIDGVGEWATASIMKGAGSQISKLAEMKYPHSLGLLYSAFTAYLGFRVNSGEYKLMGLAPYGNMEKARTIYKTILPRIARLLDDGSIWLDLSYFRFMTGLRMYREDRWQELLGIPPRQPESEPGQIHADLALAIQLFINEAVLRLAKHACKITGSGRLCLSGGVALNCIANQRLIESGLFEDIYVQPAAGDAGGAAGAALAVSHMMFGEPRTGGRDGMKGSFTGPSFTMKEIETTARKLKAVFRIAEGESLFAEIAGALAEGKIIGWFRGRMEYGPRALGNRSILANPMVQGMQSHLNRNIKFREAFRPFAPAVLAADADKYFDLPKTTLTRYMLTTAPLKAEWRNPLPEHFEAWGMTEKLAADKSVFNAVTHVDFSARVQTVDQELNPDFHRLLYAFKALTGHGMLINTSFNMRGLPPVCTPEDAIYSFMNTGMDILVIENCIFVKEDQPDASLFLSDKYKPRED